jgi:hypothetical protein
MSQNFLDCHFTEGVVIVSFEPALMQTQIFIQSTSMRYWEIDQPLLRTTMNSFAYNQGQENMCRRE